jgi:hypothetical protein
MTVEKSGSRPGLINDRTGAQLPPHGATCVNELELTGMRLSFFDLQFPLRAAPQQRLACTPKATYMAHFF